METDCGSKTNEIEAQGLDLHLCIICQRKKTENLVEKPEAHEKVWVSIKEWSKYGQSAKTADWLVDNDVVWPVLRNCACANPRKFKIDKNIEAWRLNVS